MLEGTSSWSGLRGDLSVETVVGAQMVNCTADHRTGSFSGDTRGIKLPHRRSKGEQHV